ncbi:hypothetical protein GH714_007560 [Hevea brasiliensis]|uniref:Uncharacterized protein n=1 Tax=Hevea brasiliensis TaxID=3981 RepID=A0A6A6L359_HEVBR|nr:hypothetical protein GH714_007560 [Hevea brasiliensis]
MNTYHSLEEDAIDALREMYPRLHTIGPLQLFLDQIKDNELKRINPSLWKEETGCIEWLDSKEPNSVLFVNFGSTTEMKPEQLVEFSWGLATARNHSCDNKTKQQCASMLALNGVLDGARQNCEERTGGEAYH